MSICKPYDRSSRDAGFTLIELLVVISIIGILIGFMLPVLQHRREVTNWDRAQQDVSQIVEAESNLKQFTTNLAELAKLGLIDPTLGTGSKDGYNFAATISADGGYRIIGVPASPGITGSFDVEADQTGAVTSTPSIGADEARTAMFSAIDAEAATAIGRLLTKTPVDELPAVQRFFHEGAVQDPCVLKSVFKRLDADGDGKVTLSEIVSYDQNSDSALGAFLSALNRIMQLGLANEDVQSLPGVGLSDLLPDGQNDDRGLFHVRVGHGTASIDALEPDVSLAGLCDGSVRFATHTQVRLDGAEFSAQLHFASQHILSGQFVISTDEGETIHGILIGLEKQEGRKSEQSLDGLFLVTGGSGSTAGIFGSGRASIDWCDLKHDLFKADLEARVLFTQPAQ